MRRRQLLALAAATLSSSGWRAISSASEVKASLRRFRIIDGHLHVFNSDVQGKNRIPRYMPPSTVEHTLRLMDEAAIEKAVLISYSAEDVATEIRQRGYSPVDLQPVISLHYQFEAWRAHKDRFWWFPDSISPVQEGYAEELERNFRKGAAGIKLLLPFHGLLPDHPAWYRVYELCRKYRKPIIWEDGYFLYIKNPAVYPINNESRARQKLARSLRSFDEYAERILDPIFKEFSDLPISLAHVGVPNVKEEYASVFALMDRHPNLSCDLASVLEYSHAFIETLVKAIGAERIMYGSDSPWGGDFRKRWSLIAEAPFLSDYEKQRMLAGNVERFIQCQLPVVRQNSIAQLNPTGPT